MKKLPTKISPSPIVEAIVELRFQAKIDADAIFGVVYNSLKEDYPSLEKLPILQIPVFLRQNEPNLTFKPYYKLSNDHYILQIGPDVVTISCTAPYTGWQDFFKIVSGLFGKLKKLDFIKNVVRLGIRYINIFEKNIYEHINLRLTLNDKSLSGINSILRSEFPENGYVAVLQIANNAKYTSDKGSRSGSVIDIDVGTIESNVLDFSDIDKTLNEAHEVGKKLFFALLDKGFLKQLKPVYQEKRQ